MDDNELSNRLRALDGSLEVFGVGDDTPWQLAQIFNVLLEAVKASHGDDPVVAVIEPLKEATSQGHSLGVSRTHCGTVRGAIDQLRFVSLP